MSSQEYCSRQAPSSHELGGSQWEEGLLHAGGEAWGKVQGHTRYVAVWHDLKNDILIAVTES